ncbi:ArsR family transcriptional regulator [Natronococcus sp. A-GB7]|uniref:ArsR family transcriptional regulator n=1 Tax=Natronococcus sp. A-GB7 TaxID=3037649 RepID=UPI00241F9F64|nr:ArsR family transcriptional regulator [Natronococcus sp. A-GB7]MDG5820787.1 ArsR family transcriptional regulator [Natronococcus sp. A-GB7]
MMTEKRHSPPSMDTVLNVLENQYRRRVLVALLEHNPQDAEDPKTPSDSELADEDLETLRIHMTHTHLPKLEVSGFIEWERDTNSIRKGPNFDEIQPLLELMQNHADELPDGWL